ncbi:11071_t:CDS:2 [Funneliformis caledonium]|uniref:11071_t:CDS:1 n=1 Tax=Funneliformis caledonium TaxID=1117310 RepID=A0A9N9AFG2_9GLOM|nr:11071_t:CDS:2 [Funneliformis caledonium]
MNPTEVISILVAPVSDLNATTSSQNVTETPSRPTDQCCIIPVVRPGCRHLFSEF